MYRYPPCPYCNHINSPHTPKRHHPNTCNSCQCPYCSRPMYYRDTPQPYRNRNGYRPYIHKKDIGSDNDYIEIYDYGPDPFVVNIEEITQMNDNFRTALWTGDHLQLTLMSIPVNGEIGLEVHPDTDQFLRIEDGYGLVVMGDNENNLYFQEMIYEDDGIVIPAGKWHNIVNMGDEPLKLYSIYAPPHHPHGTVHETKEDDIP